MKLGTMIGILAASSLIGCGSGNLLSQRQRHEAPKGPQDTGILLTDTKETDIDALLTKHPEARVRTLNGQHGMYEVFNVKAADIEKQIDRPVSENVYFRLEDKPNLFSVPAPAGLHLPGMNVCRKALEIPVAKLELSALKQVQNGGSLELGQTVRVNTGGSAAANSFPSAIKRTLILNGPSASGIRDQLVTSETYEFTPDTLGVYQAIVVIQDSRDVCAMDGVLFIVTANRPYLGKNTPDLKIDLSELKHLDAVHAADAWKVSDGSGITIAVIDTGVNYNHPALAPNVLVNENEIPDNGIDDDHNGVVDDIVGYDFVNADGYAYDDDAHGTHVAGLAAGRQFGLARKASILPIKALTGLGGDIGSISAAIVYAVDRGARVINMSLGAPAKAPHPVLAKAVAYAEAKGVVIVAAAGNGDPATGLGFSIDVKTVYPASLNNENVIGVAASETNGFLAPYSNFGRNYVEVIAPGGNMPSDPMISAAFENPKGQLFTAMSGTSMAAPVTSGIVASVLSVNPRLTVRDLRDILLAAGDSSPELQTASASGRVIDAFKAVELATAKNVFF